MPVTNYLNWVFVAYSECSLMNSLTSITSSRTLIYVFEYFRGLFSLFTYDTHQE